MNIGYAVFFLIKECFFCKGGLRFEQKTEYRYGHIYHR